VAISSKDVAKVAQASYGTVSGVLSDRLRIKSETNAPVPRATAEMGYVPSGNLMIRHTHTLAVPPGAVRAPHCPLLLQRPYHAWRCAHAASLRIPQGLPVAGFDIDSARIHGCAAGLARAAGA
jgi:hypothetical protein